MSRWRCVAYTGTGKRCRLTGDVGRYPALCGAHVRISRNRDVFPLFTPMSSHYGFHTQRKTTAPVCEHTGRRVPVHLFIVKRKGENMPTDPEVMEKELYELAEKVIDGDSAGTPDHPAALRLAQMVRARYTNNAVTRGTVTGSCSDQEPHPHEEGCSSQCAGY